MNNWLSVIGLGEDGLAGLSPPAYAALEGAEIIIGAKRHHALAPGFKATRITWPTPFREMREEITTYRGKRVAVLVTGDPLWYSVGAFFARNFAGEVTFFPQLSAFQWAAVRMGWSLGDCETLTTHGRPCESVLPFLAPELRLLVLTEGADTPDALGKLLTEAGFGTSTLSVLANLGGENETRDSKQAQSWIGHKAPPFHTIAIECKLDEGRTPPPRIGLDDDLFEHDGKMTKREIRTITLGALDPRRGQLLWDIGAGCGSIGIEWMRAGRDMQAIGLEPSDQRRALAATNAMRLGAPRFDLRTERAPEGLSALPAPDAVFIGGGLCLESVEIAHSALKAGGRLVANSVTLESEALLIALQKRYGGRLLRLAISRAEPLGTRHGWRPLMPVTQWVLVK